MKNSVSNLVFYRYCKFFFVTIACIIQTNIFGGITPLRFNAGEIVIHKLNYEYFIGKQICDSAVAYFIHPVSLGKKDDSVCQKNADSNRLFINTQLKSSNIFFFRLFFKNQRGVYRYIDFSIKNKLMAEANMVQDDLIEIQKFYQAGTVMSRTLYRFIPPTGETNSEQFCWYARAARLIKDGVEKIFYINNRLRIQREYVAGRLKDTLYTEFNSTGAVHKTYTVSNGKVAATKSFEKNAVINKKAFLFGLDNYAVPDGSKNLFQARLPNLAGCENDVNLLKKVLTEDKGFDSHEIYRISGMDASKASLLKSFYNFSNGVKKGDIVFIHFSGMGMISEASPGNAQLIIACNDYYKYKDESGFISQMEFEQFLNAVQSAAGVSGQVILSLDVCHAGYFLSESISSDTVNINPISNSFRGESNNILFRLIKNGGASTFIYASSSKDGFSVEMKGRDGKSYGYYTSVLADIMSSNPILNSQDLFDNIQDSMKEKGQTPGYLAKESQFLFEKNVDDYDSLPSLPKLSLKAKAYSISVGINSYNTSTTKLHFDNCVSDAADYAAYFLSQYRKAVKDGDSSKIFSTVLLNENATKQKIIEAVNSAISSSRPEDYFIFNFSGYCKPLKDSAGKNVTWFVPYGLSNIADDKEIREKGISLKQLKELLQLIPANNQLFITEAGSTTDFQREFIQALIETSPTIASLSNKNRIFIVPKSSGMDNCICKNKYIEHGPLNFYITNMSNELNIFGLFDDSLYASAIKFELSKQEVECNYFRTGYFDIFFEKDFVKDLKYFLPEEIMQSRGGETLAEDRESVASNISRRFALVVGTDIYKGKPDWGDLNNPVSDATEIATALRNNFGFTVKLLQDKPSDSIYNQILWLSHQLQPSDQLLIYIAGHGDFDDRLFDDGFIVCNNSNTTKDDPYRNSYIQYSKLSRMINRLPARQILMVLDVCFGGTFDERVARNKSRGREDTYSDLTADTFFREKMKKNTRLYLTSGGKKEVPDGYKGKHSPFAIRLLQALQTRGGAAKILTASDLFQFVKMLPSGPLLGSFGDDEPGSEFVMLGK